MSRISSYSSSLPEGWRWVKLGEVSKQDRQIVEPNTAEAEDLTYYSLEHIESETGRILKSPIEHIENEGKSTTFRFDERHVLYGKLRPYLNKVALPDSPGRCTTEMIPLLPLADVDREFLAWLLRRRETVDSAMQGKTGSRMPRADMDSLLNIIAPLPPLLEQRRIVGVLAEQVAAVEKIRAEAETRLEAVKALPTALLRQVFPQPGDPLPDGWRWIPLGEVLVLRKDIIHPRDNPEGLSVFVGLEHIESNTGRRLDSVKVEMSELTGRKPRFFKGDIVYGYLRPYLNKVWIAEFDGLCSVDQYVYNVASQKINTLYVAYFMRSPLFIENSPVGKTPGWLPRIRTDEVACIEIPLPPLDEQKQIAGLLKERMEAAEKASVVAEEEMETIDALPAALLRRAFSGKI